jgi:hypothetical protein
MTTPTDDEIVAHIVARANPNSSPINISLMKAGAREALRLAREDLPKDDEATRLKYDAPQGSGCFELFDPEPDNHHSALYLVDPNGAAFNISCWDQEGVDIARGEWMRDTLNAALQRAPVDRTDEAKRLLKDVWATLHPNGKAADHIPYQAAIATIRQFLATSDAERNAAVGELREALERIAAPMPRINWAATERQEIAAAALAKLERKP